MSRPISLSALDWLRTLADAEATVPARVVLERLEAEPSAPVPVECVQPSPGGSSWRERLWTSPPETRLTIEEAAEALGMATSTLYKRVCPSAEDPIPSHRQGNRRVFIALELRDFLEREAASCSA